MSDPKVYMHAYIKREDAVESIGMSSYVRVSSPIVGMSGYIQNLPQTFARVAGAWKALSNIFVRIGDVWETMDYGYVRIGGVWKRFYRKTILLIIAADTEDYNIYNEAGQPTGDFNVILTINPGVRVSSSDPAIPAITTGLFPVGTELTIINKGAVKGLGGAGGDGGECSGHCAGYDGGAGGDAIDLQIDANIDNTLGEIFGGGGGGGGGGGVGFGGPVNFTICLGGGGGGGGQRLGDFGLKGCGSGLCDTTDGCGEDGTIGGEDAPGAGGAGLEYILPSEKSGDGGDGGAFGEAGQDGQIGTVTAVQYSLGGTGGAAGKAVALNGNSVIWLGGNNPTQVKGDVA